MDDPKNLRELARTLASLTDEEYTAVADAARGPQKGNHVPGVGNQPNQHLAGINGLTDPADRRRSILASIGDKQRRILPEHVDANGYRCGPEGNPVNYATTDRNELQHLTQHAPKLPPLPSE